ncbi:MAG: hypothetical protein ABDH63_02785 [Candidatus Caldarchaeales archaeon]
MRVALVLLRVKLRHYLGSVFDRPRNFVFLLIVYSLWLAVTGIFSLALRFAGVVSGSGPTGFLPVLTEVTVIAVMAAGIYLGLKGGVTAFPYEIDFVLPSRVKPRAFLVSDALFQFVMLSLFVVPPVALMIWTITYPAHVAYLTVAMPCYAIAMATAILLSHVIGLSRTKLGEGASRFLGWSLMASVLMPLGLSALGVPRPTELRYHPALILAHAVTRGSASDFLYLLPYVAVLSAAYFRLSGTNFYPSVTPLLVSALMDRPTAITARIAIPAVLSRVLGLRASSGLSGLMYSLHLTRVAREGSLLTGATILVLLTLGNTAVPRMMGGFQFPELAQLTMIALYVPLLPALLAINWSLSERRNLWLVKMSPWSERQYLSGLLLAYVTVSLPFSLVLYSLVSVGVGELPFLAVDLILLASMSYFGSALAVLASLTVRIESSPLSLGSLVFIVVPLAGSALLSLPVLVLRTLEPLASSPTLTVISAALIYVAAFAAVLYRSLVRGGTRYLT